jgi:hypothetical protein
MEPRLAINNYTSYKGHLSKGMNMPEDPKNRIHLVPNMPTPPYGVPNIADSPAMKEIYDDAAKTRQKQEKIFDDISNELKNVTQQLKEINTKLSQILSKLK